MDARLQIGAIITNTTKTQTQKNRMKNTTTNQTDRKRSNKSLVALTSHEINIVRDALSANRHLIKQDWAKYLTALRQDEMAPALDEREKRNLKAGRDICENEIMEISALIQEINGQLIHG